MSVTQARIAHYLFAAGVVTALAWQSDLRAFALTNLLVQAVIFVALACVPAYRTGYMTYVDLAWPWGLVALGVLTLGFGDLGAPLTLAVAAIYLAMGARMGIMAVRMVGTNGLTHELARYRYQRRRWARAGLRSERLSMQVEIMLQGAANMGILAIPAALAAAGSRSLGVVEIVALIVWVVSYVFESLADWQKARFGALSERQGIKRSCDVGLWRYSRHPNYFGQWMQWNALIVLVLPTLLDRRSDTSILAWVITLIGLAAISKALYNTLVYFTGAVPAEYYSLQSRPDYAGYQAITSRFFPRPRRSGATPEADGRESSDPAHSDSPHGKV
ncbi:DUF1295 domain-containing protein [Nocardia sp. NBC_01499]|uniref:DUF1295 domain-containing protein n=1 Tax=Nocardia sp. NBC_01499 TaxID=2903597 RepID=UPI003868D15F